MAPKVTKLRKIEPSIWLMSDNRYLLDLTLPGGSKNDRIRKKHKTQGEAKRHKAFLLNKRTQSPEWAPKKQVKDTRRLSELVNEWHTAHGQFLKDGLRRKVKLEIICNVLGDPIAQQLDKEMFADFRTTRAETVKLKTVNNEHGYLCSMFNTLIQLGKWKHANPVENIPKFKLAENELTYLEGHEIVALLRELDKADNQEPRLIAEICLSTGARWMEAQKLSKSQIKGQSIQFSKTKSKRNRFVAVDDALHEKLKGRYKDHSERLFSDKRNDHIFDAAVLAANITLPEGQATHVLRHTFATHFLINGGDIRELRDILGHTCIKTTERYLHLIRSKQTRATQINPITMLREASQ